MVSCKIPPVSIFRNIHSLVQVLKLLGAPQVCENASKAAACPVIFLLKHPTIVELMDIIAV